MNIVARRISVRLVFGLAAVVVVGVCAAPRAQSASKSALTGAWTLNKDLSDQPPRRGEDMDGERAGRGAGRGAGGSGRGMGRGGFGGGVGHGRGGMDPEAMARMRQAMREITEPSDRLTITETESMVVLTDSGGRTTRLSTDGKKVKDENTRIERKTQWQAGKLVSEISGAGPRKFVQTFAVDPEARQLRIIIQTEGGRDGQPRTITHVYDRAEH